MRLSLVGIDYRTAPVMVRERAAINGEGLGDFLASLRVRVPHCIVLSTCNRTEIYAVGGGGGDPMKASWELLKHRIGVSEADLGGHVYMCRDDDAADHLFRVACGLESMILGEYEVLGQIAQALEAAEKAGTVNLSLRHVFQCALRAGRRVREETAISQNALSVSSVAIDLAVRILGDLRKCTMLVIGAGEAGRLVAKVAMDMGTSEIVIASRRKERALELATALRGRAVDMTDLSDELGVANVVVTCASAPHRLLSFPQIESLMMHRPDLPLVVIDIAVPRNVDPEVGRIRNVFLYNIDDLTEISNANRRHREAEMGHAESILSEELGQLALWWRDSEVRPVVGALMSKAEKIRSTQLNRTLGKLPPLSDEQLENLESMTKSIVTKILKEPVKYLKANGNGHGAEMLKEIFGLDIEGDR